MNYLIEIMFVITLVIIIVNLLTVITSFGRRVYWFPEINKTFSPYNFLFIYPSLCYQIWWWCMYFNIY